MRKTTSFFFIFGSFLVFSQSQYQKGFNEGFRNGYCHGEIAGCVAPVPPIAPIDLTMNFQSGYNNGFIEGKNAKEKSNVTKTTTIDDRSTSYSSVNYTSGHANENQSITEKKNYSYETEVQINNNIQKFYAEINELKSQVRHLQNKIAQINTENISNDWNSRKNYIFSVYRSTISGIESSIELIPKVEGQSQQLIWCGKVSNMINSFRDELISAQEVNGTITNLINDSSKSKVVYKKSNLYGIYYKDLMNYLIEKTGKTAIQIENEAKEKGYNYTRQYMEELAKKYME